MSKSNIVRGNILTALAVQVSLDLPSVATVTTAVSTVTVNGAKTTDMVFASLLTNPTAGYSLVGAWVSAADTVSLRFSNVTAGTIDPATFSINLLLIKPEYFLTSV